MLCRAVHGDLRESLSCHFVAQRSQVFILVRLTRFPLAPPTPWFRSSRMWSCVMRSFHSPGPRSGAASPVLPSSRAHRLSFRWLGVTSDYRSMPTQLSQPPINMLCPGHGSALDCICWYSRCLYPPITTYPLPQQSPPASPFPPRRCHPCH
ncbi:hypothetical protein BU23DRAFT_298806 [Bimuria novae-zelandiae CBS 107.79]|uniref:Uncharacterized protein n=1 Tax=Bimuria novae-zelandiae CBS 107.79 TaxID=1447943 RepID=A0A6A5VP91_9PLEO|nr:hypothetical protein BU23DRAFT_298806 [Bimuria novae-zelandiae CBS 107.79]